MTAQAAQHGSQNNFGSERRSRFALAEAARYLRVSTKETCHGLVVR